MVQTLHLVVCSQTLILSLSVSALSAVWTSGCPADSLALRLPSIWWVWPPPTSQGGQEGDDETPTRKLTNASQYGKLQHPSYYSLPPLLEISTWCFFDLYNSVHVSVFNIFPGLRMRSTLKTVIQFLADTLSHCTRARWKCKGNYRDGYPNMLSSCTVSFQAEVCKKSIKFPLLFIFKYCL